MTMAKTFSSPINLNNSPVLSTHPQIEADGNNVYVTWEEEPINHEGIFFSIL
jgi:hypothetical protein